MIFKIQISIKILKRSYREVVGMEWPTRSLVPYMCFYIACDKCCVMFDEVDVDFYANN